MQIIILNKLFSILIEDDNLRIFLIYLILH